MGSKFGTIITPLLRWDQPHLGQRSHALTSENVTFATLEWPNVFRSIAIASMEDGEYTFKRGGFVHTYLTVYRKGSEAEIARLNLSWRGSGELVFTNGRRYRFARHGMAGYDHSVSNGRGEPLFDLKREWSAFKHHGRVRLLPAGQHEKDVGLLISLCWYLIIMLVDDDVAMASAASVH